MPRWLKILLKVFATVVAIALTLVGAVFAFLWFTSGPSKLVDFKPTTFAVKADEAFFYSIDGAIKYSSSIDPAAPTIIAGSIKNVVVAPDNRSALAVVGDSLYLVTPDSARSLTRVGSIYRSPKPIGQKFTRDRDFQWSRDGRTIYVIRDEYYDTPSQLFSEKGELWMADVATDKVTRVLAPFPASDYALGANGSVYFIEPEDGNLILKHFDGDSVAALGEYPIRGPYPATVTDTPFVSFKFDPFDNRVEATNVRLDAAGAHRFVLAIDDKPVLTTTISKGIYGTHSCLTLTNSAFLPGDRFFLVNPECGGYEGSLLIEVASGRYMKIPGAVRVYPVSNSARYPAAP